MSSNEFFLKRLCSYFQSKCVVLCSTLYNFITAQFCISATKLKHITDLQYNNFSKNLFFT